MSSPPAARPALFLVPTPIGNLGDITLRALECLRTVDAVAAEDTRRSRGLLAHFSIHKPLVRLDAHTIGTRGRAALERYPRLAYVTDAGTPGLSDPGAELVALALSLGGTAEALPGPTAFIPALVLSGLPAERFCFLGFLPRSGPTRRERLLEIERSATTSVFYESPHRVAATLAELVARCGPARRCAVARELTKLHEEVYRGSLGEALSRFGPDARGEFVLVVGPREGEREPQVDRAAEAAGWARDGEPARRIRARLMAAGLDRNAAYALALEATGARPTGSGPTPEPGKEPEKEAGEETGEETGDERE